MALQIIQVLRYWSQGEITAFIKVWTLVFSSLCYSFLLTKHIPKGIPRLLSLIPILSLNLILPLNLHTLHLGGSTAFFLAWLANFKLIMFAFQKGPLSDPFLTLPRFIALACLPIKSHTQDKTIPSPKRGLKSFWNYAVKGLLICVFLKMYDYTDSIHPKLTWVLYGFHIYFGLEIILAFVGGLAEAVVGIRLEPQFDEPYLSASLQEFWGRRWNIMVNRILRPAVYEPVLGLFARVAGRKWASLPAVMGSFLVSGLMHELIFYYMGRHRPTGRLTVFFVLHGVALVVEIVVKKAIKGQWQPSRLVTGPLTIGFVMVTGIWLFLPEFLRCDAVNKGLNEYSAVGRFMKDVSVSLFGVKILNDLGEFEGFGNNSAFGIKIFDYISDSCSFIAIFTSVFSIQILHL